VDARDAEAFFATRDRLDAEAYVELDYVFECAGDPRLAAAHLASETSTAQWRRPGVDEDFRARFGARVLSVDAEPIGRFSIELPHAPSGPVHRVRATLGHPHANFGANLPALVSTVAGEGAFHAPGIPLLRLEDVRFPASYLAHFSGPRHGVAGVRERLGVHGRPVFFGVVKPNLGLAPADFAALAHEAWLGGLDVAKDDEMLVDTAWSPLAERARACVAAARAAQPATGQGAHYLANITADGDALLANLRVAEEAGASLVMVNAVPVGWAGLRLVAQHATVPVVSHFVGKAAMTRVPAHGVHARVLVTLERLAGADVIIMPGFGSRMMTPDDEVHACVRACLAPLGSIKPALPVPGGSDWAGTLAPLHAKLGTVDFGFVPGRGVFAHPDGPRAGAESLRAAWAAIESGGTLGEAARGSAALARAVEVWGASP
jgi:ribulose-bisphosphate carboxylase large chain